METSGKYSSTVSDVPNPNLVPPSGIRVFDLAFESQSLALAKSPERKAMTIARLQSLRLTLMTLKAGAIVKEHKSDHEISIQTVSGRVVLHTGQGRLDLPTGHVAVLERGAVHDVEAQSDSTILITVCLSPDASPA